MAEGEAVERLRRIRARESMTRRGWSEPLGKHFRKKRASVFPALLRGMWAQGRTFGIIFVYLRYKGTRGCF